MMSKTAVQKDRLPFQFDGAASSFEGGGAWAPKPKPSYTSLTLPKSLIGWGGGYSLPIDPSLSSVSHCA